MFDLTLRRRCAVCAHFAMCLNKKDLKRKFAPLAVVFSVIQQPIAGWLTTNDSIIRRFTIFTPFKKKHFDSSTNLTKYPFFLLFYRPKYSNACGRSVAQFSQQINKWNHMFATSISGKLKQKKTVKSKLVCRFMTRDATGWPRQLLLYRSNSINLFLLSFAPSVFSFAFRRSLRFFSFNCLVCEPLCSFPPPISGWLIRVHTTNLRPKAKQQIAIIVKIDAIIAPA